MLGILPEKPNSTWREQVPTLVHAYNRTRNNVTDVSLYYPLFDRKLHLPIDILFGTNTADSKGNTSTSMLKISKGEQNGNTRLQMKLLRRNRSEINGITIIRSDVHN